MEFRRQERYPFSYLPDRPDYSWPEGRRLAFYVATNLECFSYKSGFNGLESSGGAPTHRDFARRDYGLRVGLAYVIELFDELGLRVAHNVNSYLYEHYGAVFDRIRTRGDEIVAHGRTNSERQDALSEADEAALIREVTRTIERHERVAPQGWMGPWRAETDVTIDLLKEAGYRYFMDWPCDDQPIWMRTRSGPILSVPYPLEASDGTAIAREAHSGREFADLIVDQFDEMVEQSRSRPLVCGIALHPFVIGHPFRIRALRQALTHCINHRHKDRVWVTLPGMIADQCYQFPQRIPQAGGAPPDATTSTERTS